jgi:hypothetical protein
MSTLVEDLKAEIVRLEAKHGSDNKFVKDLKEQLRASEATSGKTAQEVFRMQSFDFTPKLPAAPTREQFSTQDEFDEALGGWQSRVGRIRGLTGTKRSSAS